MIARGYSTTAAVMFTDEKMGGWWEICKLFEVSSKAR
jgi:hypothetical protein